MIEKNWRISYKQKLRRSSQKPIKQEIESLTYVVKRDGINVIHILNSGCEVTRSEEEVINVNGEFSELSENLIGANWQRFCRFIQFGLTYRLHQP